MTEASDFDSVGQSYDAELEQGLGLTGEGKDYFAEGRVQRAQAVLAARALRPARVVDYGCGNGDTLPLLAKAFPGAEVIGCEPSEALRSEARRRHREFSFHEPQGLSGADVVYCNGVVHHVPLVERGAFFASIAAALRPGGYLTLFENNPLNPGTRWVMRRIPFDRDAVPVMPWELTRLVRGAGLEICARHYLFFFPHVLRRLRSLERSLRTLPLGGQYMTLARRPTTAAG